MKIRTILISIIYLCLQITITGFSSVKVNGDVIVEKVADGLSAPVYVTHSEDGSGRLFIVEQAGRIVILKNGEILEKPFLDIRSKVAFSGEMGLLSIAFHPDFIDNGRFFVNYTNSEDGDINTIVSEFNVSSDNPDEAEENENIILKIAQPFSNHNGGQLHFGPDGFLYIGMGDGGSGGDPLNNGQNLDTLLGSLLRIDINSGSPFTIPEDNPFRGIDGADEIYAYGLRNPWRFSFDRLNDRLFLADVGQNRFEEIDIIEPGKNYGWNIKEGNNCFSLMIEECNQPGLTPPIIDYSHSEGRSITGGYVYRGSEVPELFGAYIFGDFVTSKVWTTKEDNAGLWSKTLLFDDLFPVSSFGEDEDGELYIIDYTGALFKFKQDNKTGPFPDPSPTPTGKLFTVKCNKDFRSGTFSIDKLIITKGENISCTLKLTNPEPDVNVKTRVRVFIGNKDILTIDPKTGITDQNGEIQFNITATDKGTAWIAWSLENNENISDSGSSTNRNTWGAIVRIR